jgi:hypothetical protein
MVESCSFVKEMPSFAISSSTLSFYHSHTDIQKHSIAYHFTYLGAKSEICFEIRKVMS